MLFVYVCVWGGSWGVDLGWMPLPTHHQQYCDPVFLVKSRATRLYNPLYWPVRRSVYPLVCPSGGLSVGPSVTLYFFIILLVILSHSKSF